MIRVKFQIFTLHTVNLFAQPKHLLTTNTSVMTQWVLSPLSLRLRSNLDWWSWMMYPFLQAAQQQICISRPLTPTGQGDVNCIFCIEFFSGLSRSQGTKNGILLPSPTFDIQSASVHAKNSKFPEESTIQHWTMFTLQDTANAPPQMLLDNPEFTSSMSSLLEKASQNRQNTHAIEKSLEMVTCQANPYGCPKIQWDPLHRTDQALLQESHNRPQKNNDAPHWAPIVTQGCFLGQ